MNAPHRVDVRPFAGAGPLRNRPLTVLPLVVLALARPALADDTYKDFTNPTGVPDLTQGDTAICYSASWADAMWWFNQYHPGLADTSAKDWHAEGVSVRDKIAFSIGEKSNVVNGNKGAMEYLFSRRKQDFKAKPAKGDPRWGIVYHGPLENTDKRTDTKYAPSDLRDIVAAGMNDPHQLTVLLLKGQKKGSDKLFDYLPDAHAVVASGLSTSKDSFTNLIISNPWGDHPVGKEPNQPVHQSFYDKLSAKEVDPGKDGVSKKLLRIDDPALTGAKNWDQPIEYADVALATTLVDNFVSTYRFRNKQDGGRPGGGLGGAAGISYLSEHNLTNDGDTPLEFFAFELPGATDQSPLSLGDLNDLSLPQGWAIDLWNPNETQYMTPLHGDDDGEYGRTYRGLFAYATSPTYWLQPGQDLNISFHLDGSLFDPSVTTASYAVANFAYGFAGESLGVVPAPATAAALAAPGLLALRRRRERR